MWENKIVLIVPPGNENELETFEDIEKVNRIALGDPASVPAGQYAREALTSLGLWDELQERLSLGSHVTEVLNQVAAASADAGIVYATDAAFIEDRVYVVAEAPDGSISEKIIYPAAVIKNSTHPDTAEKFVEFLQTEAAMRVFESYGKYKPPNDLRWYFDSATGTSTDRDGIFSSEFVWGKKTIGEFFLGVFRD